ncbi:MAG: hypothetical protein P4L82_20855 [Ancalomicrobiaceae bacterium]|nr:hypothetical protein [Ancalomicrobiaceae bacterium]
MKVKVLLAIVPLVAAATAMACGFAGGLARLGLGPDNAVAIDAHGAFMICGFFGTLIALERAVAGGRLADFLAPAFGAAGVILTHAGLAEAAASAYGLSALMLTGLTLLAAIRQPEPFTILMAGAAAIFTYGCVLWIRGETAADVAYLWLGFLVLTVLAERLELSRLRAHSPAALGLLGLFLAVFVGALITGEPWQHGSAALGGSLIAAALWFLLRDVAVVTIRQRGLARFSAVCLMTGYGWLIVAGSSLIALPPGEAMFGHDMAVHAIGLGFVLSMVMAHAPIILPAIVGLKVRYQPALYGPVLVLQAGVAARMSGDILESDLVRQVSAVLTVTAVVLYLAILVVTRLADLLAERRRRPSPAL